MKKTFRRFVSLVLAGVMSLGMFPFGTVTALASPGPADGQVEYAGGTNSATGSYDIEVSKTIEAVAGKENYFDITLKTTTHRHKVDMSTDVVVVLDISNTMNADSTGNEGAADANKKITFAKNATKTFVNAFCTNENLDSNRKLGIVTFNRDAKVAVGLTEANDITDYNSISTKINSITAPTGNDVKWTNIEAGIRLAENVLANSTAKYKYIILLTDGFPTTYLKSHNPSGTGTLSGYDPRMSGSYDAGKINNEGYFANTRTKQLCTGGTSYSNRAAEYAESAAASAIKNGINIFTVGVALASQDIDDFLTYIVDTTGMASNENYAIGNTEATYKSWLENSIAGGNLLDGTSGVKYTDAYNQNQLEKDYEKILDAIEHAPASTMRTFYTVDPMSDVVDFVGFFNKNGNLVSGNLSGESKQGAENTATYTSSDETIVWDTLRSGYTMEGENLVFTLKYRIRLQNESAGFSFENAYDANKRTTLNYSQNYEDGTPVPEGTGSIDYPIPEIEGYKGSLKFRKIDTDTGEPISGVKFTLQHYGNSCSVCSGDAPIGDVTAVSDENGYVSFENIPSGHEYVLIEEVPEGYAPIHNHAIIVSYGKTYLGTVSPENEIVDGKRNGGAGELFLVKNTKVQSPELHFTVKKSVEDLGTLSGGEYSFELKGTGINNVSYHETRTNDASGLVTFGKMIFDIPGTYNYTVSEVTGTDGTVIYDPAEYDIQVVVTTNTEETVTTAEVFVDGTSIGSFIGDKDSEAVAVSLTGDAASFTNKGRAGTEVVLSAKKTFDKALSEGMFSFVLMDSGKNVIRTVENAADGSVVFEKIAYTEPGTYVYYIKEVIGSDKTVAYDPAVYTATVKVTAPSDLTSGDALSATVTYAKADGTTVSEAVFSNRTKLLPTISAYGYKSLNGVAAAADTFSFVLEEITIDTIIDGENTNYSYSVKPGTATEYKNGAEGALDFSARLSSEVSAMIEEIISGTDYSTSRYYRIREIPGTEDGIVYDEKAYILLIGVSTTPESENFVLDVVLHEESGTPVFSKFGAVSVAITPDEIHFENSNKVRVELPVEKTLETTDPEAINGNYHFVLTDKNGNTTPLVITGAGKASFELFYTSADIGTHRYTVHEVRGSNPSLYYDDTIFVAEITVGIDANGMVFAEEPVITDANGNSHTAVVFLNKDLDPTHLHLSAIKTINGEVPSADERFPFELVLCMDDGTELSVVEKVQSYRGTVTFSELVFNSAGTYNYVIREVLPSDQEPGKEGIQHNGYTYDETEYTLMVVVTDTNEDGILEQAVYLNGKAVTVSGNLLEIGSFSNHYSAKPVTAKFEGKKTLSGKELESGAFGFVLEPVTAGAPVPVHGTTAYSDSDGNFAFGNITFTEAGIYEYTVSEIIPAEATGGKHNGIVYDSAIYSVVVTVTDNREGSLLASVTVDGKAYGADSISFENRYEATPVSVRFSAEKLLSGRPLQKGEFAFRIAELDSAGNEIPGTSEVVRNGAYNPLSSVYFSYIEYTAPGTHRYVITEVLPEDDDPLAEGIQNEGVTYSEASHEVTVEVTDDGNGNLAAKINNEVIGNIYDVGDFSNSYSYKETSVNPEVTKKLTGRDWFNTDEFVFVLSPANSATKAAVNNKTVVITQTESAVSSDTPDKKAVFDDIIFHAPGTYNFTITEKAGSIDLIEYDSHALNITVNVTDNGLGELVAEMNYFGYIEFTNKYTPDGIPVQLEAEKILSGKALSGGEFSFELRDESGNLLQTKTNGKDGKVIFDSIEFTKAGTYNYTISEIKGTLGGITYDSTVYEVSVTVSYDSASGLFSSAVEYKSGSSVKPGAVFENIYIPAPVAVSAEGTKELIDNSGSGKTLSDGDFLFAINPDAANPADDPVEFTKEITNDAAGNIVFIDNAVYKTAGTYIYTVSEVDNEIPGINYDASIYRITVKITDDGKGNLLKEVSTANIANPASSDIVFKNYYDPADTTATIHGHKFLTGGHKNLEAGEFTFTLTEVDSTGTPVPGGVYMETTNRSTGIYQFDPIPYDTVGTYYYIIEESVGNEPGYTYDGRTHTVKVTVSEKDGALLAEIENGAPVNGYDEYANVFVNHYEPSPAEILLSAEKELDNGLSERSVEAGEFSFVLKDKNGTVLQTKTNDEYGSVTFDPIGYSKAGTYIYTVSEVKGNLGGIVYDETVYTVTVTVTDNGGKLSADAAITVDGKAENYIVFLNEYAAEPVSVSFGGTKSLTGRSLYEEEFTFVLRDESGAVIERTGNGADGSFGFSPITYTETGTYIYTVSEAGGNLGGITYDGTVYIVTVTVTDDLEGKLHADTVITSSGEPAEAIVFSNAYVPAPAEVVFEAEKVLSGRRLRADEFSFVLKDADGNILQTVKNSANGKITFEAISFDKTGTRSYTVSEVAEDLEGVTYDRTVYSATVTVTDDGKGKLSAAVDGKTLSGAHDIGTFTNNFTPAPVKANLSGRKVLVNTGFEERKLLAGEFEFTVSAITPGAPLPDVLTVRNDENGNIVFGDMVFTEAGTYEYRIHEKYGTLGGIEYDNSEITAFVTVTYDSINGILSEPVVTYSGSGLVFTNTYTASPTYAVFEGTKALSGRNLNVGEFSFVLRDSDGNEIETVRNGPDGKFAFSRIDYIEAGVYEYTVSEVAGTLGGITYDETVYNVTVTVTDDLNGKLVQKTVYSAAGTEKPLAEFANSYKANPAEVQFEGTKVLSGRPLEPGEFEFALKDADGAVIEIVRNFGEGNFRFSVIEYDKAGTYVYSVSEIKGSLGGVTYDETIYEITVTVTDDLAGQLHAEVVITLAGEATENIVFSNSYEAKPTEVQFIGTKKLIGGSLRNGMFTFVLRDSEGNVIETVKNGKKGVFEFSPIVYTKAGTYEYTIDEKTFVTENIAFDDTVYRIVVVVEEDFEKGILTATVTYYADKKPADEIIFRNRYHEDPPEDREDEPNPDTGAPSA